jgi:hypothetical protein
MAHDLRNKRGPCQNGTSAQPHWRSRRVKSRAGPLICTLIGATLAMLTGCSVQRSIVLRNAAGETVRCDMSSQRPSASAQSGLLLGLLGLVTRDQEPTECVRSYEAIGYRVISDTQPGDRGVSATPQPAYPVMR